MSFYIYHHNDFDGIASAAVFAKFITFEFGTKFSEFSFQSVDYVIRATWEDTGLGNPNAVLDFLYHPKSDWWFDHHADPFITKLGCEIPYKRDKQKYWATNFSSCLSLMTSHFYRFFRKSALTLKTIYKDLIRWSDIIDDAKYPSVKDLYDYSHIYLNINKTISIRNDDEYFYKIIDSFYFHRIEEFVTTDSFKELIKHYKIAEEKAIDVVSEIITVDNKIAYFDQSDYDFPFQRYLAYYLFPDIYYRIAIYKKENEYSISVNCNAWKKDRNKINLGALCQKYEGGGHHDVGSVRTPKHDDAVKIARDIKTHLNVAIAK